MKYRAWKKGFKIKEIPITFVDRKEGISKMTKGIVKEAITGVWKMKFS
jgi:dolichol-phosphate mannosyltransferase